MYQLLSEFCFIFSGLILTMQISVSAILIAMVFGTTLAMMRYKKIALWAVNSFISIIRGTPLILQLSLVYFAAPQLLGVQLSVLSSSVIAFGINSSTYTAEILRAGIASVPKGQFESAQVLHISPFFMWKDIIFPQLFKNVAPMLMHEFISLIKETAVVSMIGGLDVMRKAQILSAEQYSYFKPLLMAGASYYMIILIMEHFGKKIEKKCSYAKNQ